MTIYGADYYGAPTSFYGDQAALGYSASPFLAKSWYPNLVELTWTLPTGNWSRLRLVRSSKGVPVHEDDGAIIFDVACGPSAASPQPSFTYFADRSVPGDRWHNYALFVFAIAFSGADTVTDVVEDSFGGDVIDDWIFAGLADVLVVNDHHNTKRMSDLLPSIFTTDPREGGAGQADTDSDMTRFLGLFGYQADVVRGTYESLLHLHNPDIVPARVLPLLCEEIGVPYEAQLGAANARVLLRNAMRIHKTKGTRVGIENFASSLTGWGCSVEQGRNLFLDYNDSSAEEDTGHWYPTSNCTVSRVGTAVLGAYSQTSQRAAGSFKVTSTAAGLCEIRCGDQRVGAVISTGIPIIASTDYTLSCFTQASTTTLANAVGVAWYDIHGGFLSTTIGPTSNSTVASWSTLSLIVTAPATAQFAAPIFQVTATAAAQVHYVDAWQLEASDIQTPFQEARQLQLKLTSDRTNEVPNPSFEVDTFGWVVTATATAAAATSITRLVGDHADIAGSACAQVITPGTVINEGASITITGLVPEQDYTFTAWVKAISGRTVILRAQATGGGLVSTAGVAPGAGWVRLNLVVTTALSGTATLSITSDSTSTAASVFLLDAVMLERTLQLRDYFDASTIGVNPSDFRWGGVPHASRSHLYRDFVVKSLRLTELLPDYLWPGMTFGLVVGDVVSGGNALGFGSYPFGSGLYGGSSHGPQINYGSGDYGVGDYE